MKSQTCELVHRLVAGADTKKGVGATWGPGPRKNRKAIEFVSNTVPESMENYKATKPAFNVGPSSVSQRNVAGWPMMAHF